MGFPKLAQPITTSSMRGTAVENDRFMDLLSLARDAIFLRDIDNQCCESPAKQKTYDAQMVIRLR